MTHLLRFLLTRPAGRILQDRFTPAEVRRLLRDASDDYRRERRRLPKEKRLGARCMVHLAALTAGFYRALVARGVPESEARRLTAGVTWLVYERVAALPWALSAITARSQTKRLRRTMRLVRGFPFQAPSYQRVDLPAGSDVVAFDVLRCPVADYFRTQDLSQLCVDAWCNLDGPLADRWGARLERTGTLAQGAPRCDFRWHFGPKT